MSSINSKVLFSNSVLLQPEYCDARHCNMNNICCRLCWLFHEQLTSFRIYILSHVFVSLYHDKIATLMQ